MIVEEQISIIEEQIAARQQRARKQSKTFSRAEFPGPVPLHLVMDNYGTHKKEEVRAWLKKHLASCFILCPPVPVG